MHSPSIQGVAMDSNQVTSSRFFRWYGTSPIMSALNSVGLESVGEGDYQFTRGKTQGQLMSEQNTHYLAWFAGVVLRPQMMEGNEIIKAAYMDAIEWGAQALTEDRMKNVGSQVAQGRAVYTGASPEIVEAGTRMIFRRLRDVAGLDLINRMDEIEEQMTHG